MRTKSKRILTRCVLVLLLGLLGCQDETMSLTGSLEVTFVNTADLTRNSKIYEMGNLNYSLFDDLAIDSKGKLLMELNYGNYMIEYFQHDDISGGDFGQRKAFQISPGKTTRMTIDL